MGVQPGDPAGSLVMASASPDPHAAKRPRSPTYHLWPVLEGQTVTVNGTARQTWVGGWRRSGFRPTVEKHGMSRAARSARELPVGAIPMRRQRGRTASNTRAVDDSLNLETLAARVCNTRFHRPRTLACLAPGATPATANVNDTNAVEVGLKFTSSSNGQITGIRFYKDR